MVLIADLKPLLKNYPLLLSMLLEMTDVENVTDGGGYNNPTVEGGPEKGPGALHLENGSSVEQGMRYLHIDEAIQKRVVHKLDWNIMPIVIALCMLYLLWGLLSNM